MYGSDMRKGIKFEPMRESARERLRSFNRQPYSLGFDEAHVAAPPGDQGGERSAHAHRLGKARVLVTQRRLGFLQQHEARALAADFEADHQRLPGKGRKADPP